MAGVALLLGAGCVPAGGGPATVAEVEVLRPAVTLGGAPIALIERVSAGGQVAVGGGGRAWVRHDASARVLLDGGAKLTITNDGVALAAGRVWIEAAPGAHVVVTGAGAGGVRLDVTGARFEAVSDGAGLALYVASGEITYRIGQGAAQARGQVRAGETASLTGSAATVKAAQLWDDWTGGLAMPEAGHGGRGASGRGELGARKPGSLGEARFPLSVTRLEVRTRIEHDLAITRVVETFFNPASDTLEGLYRLRVPEGAILSRFAIDRGGRWADGYVKERETARADYQAQVYEGSTRDPALLEWDAPGSYRARIYPIPAGATRRILVEYGEWLTPRSDGTRSFRYALAQAAGAPIIEELDVEVDARESGAKGLRAGLDAHIDGLRATIQRTDFRPLADFVVDLGSDANSTAETHAYRSPHRLLQRAIARITHEDDYYLLRAVPLPAQPAGQRPPLDLVILTDVSAGTDAAHLQLARTTVESLLRHLDERDRVAVAGADLDLHPPGPGSQPPQLVAAGSDAVQPLLEALARQGVGGATDLGAVLSQAAGLLDPARRSAVVYIGDALPTVGELDIKGLRERLDRLPSPLRLYGVAIGDDADLALLDGLSQGGGLAMRVGDRTAAATAALRILGHASRRTLHRVQVDLGGGLDRSYPRRAISVVEGEAMTVMARVRSGVPEEVTLSGLLDGKPWSTRLRPTITRIDDDDDLRLRWSSERLRQLLADGASGEEVAELGTRQNLITPFTSFYVPSADELSLLMRPSPSEIAAGAALSAFGCSGRSAPTAGAATEASEGRLAPPPPASPAPYDPAGAAVAERKAKLLQTVMVMGAPAAPVAAAPGGGAASAAGVFADANAGGGSGAAHGIGSLRAYGPGDGAAGDDKDTASGHLRGAAKKMSRAPAEAKPSPERSRDSRAVLATRQSGLLSFLGGGGGAADVFDPGLPATASGNATTPTSFSLSDEDERILLRIDIVAHRPRHCSAASQQSLEDRADLWRERLARIGGVEGALEIWQDASSRCELSMWADRRALLRAMLWSVGGAAQKVALYQRMSDDPAAQEFLRKGLLAAARTPEDLRVIAAGVGLSEDVQWTLVETLVAKAKSGEERVGVLEQLAHRWPADLRLKLKMMDALDAIKRPDDARRIAEEVRAAPGADAQARTAVGELLVRLGDVPAARRAFSEIVEFAPQDPQARRRLGALYLAHGWFDEAFRQFETLGALSPGDAAVLLLEAAAAAGAGRIDEALRLEQRVADTTEAGNATGLPRVAMWWSTLRLAILREDARGKHDDAALARLVGRTHRANVLHEPRALHVLLTWAHPEADCELWSALPGEPMQPAVDVAPEFGIASIGSRDAIAGPTQIEVRRPPTSTAAGLRYQAELVVISDEGQKTEQVQRFPLEFGPARALYKVRIDGRKVEVQP